MNKDSINLQKSIDHLFGLQYEDGHWWFSLEANESIGAEFIFLMHFLGTVDKEIQSGIAKRLLDVQRGDGTWALYHDGPADLSTTIECYLALKLSGRSEEEENMIKARDFIINQGGIEKSRVFTKIHLAMFGIVPWDAVPVLPPELIFMPSWFPINIYEFSSWARASIVPLMIVCSKRPIFELHERFKLHELFVNPPEKRNFEFKNNGRPISWQNFFIKLDKLLKFMEKSPIKPVRKTAIEKCADWTWEHVSKTEDIYPALAYCALAFKTLGYSNDAIQIAKPYSALLKFQQRYSEMDCDIPASGHSSSQGEKIHQQCCISPVWDTPWAMMSLLEAGVSASDPRLLKAGRWLIARQITQTKGDWAIKNPRATPGGWSFEFENEYFPDVDDTIEVLSVLKRLDLPDSEKNASIALAMQWLLSMQNNDGGWGAFDKNQNLELVNKIPFSDHGACLDPSSPDITARMLELLADHSYAADAKPVKRALKYIWRTQEDFDGWFGRWGINYIYGTWCVLTALDAIGFPIADKRMKKAASWLKKVQNTDGGWGESPESYKAKTFVPLKHSTASQTAWALMGLISAGERNSTEAKKGIDFLIKTRKSDGSWDEQDYTGTGFPGHFYIRYHGYRHYFPLLALGRFCKK